MKTRKIIIWIVSALFLPLFFSLQQQEINFKKLGKGRIIEKDRTIKKAIELYEIHLPDDGKAAWITYIKDGSLHDLLIESIDRIEFPEAEQGPVKMIFKENGYIIQNL